MNKFKESDIYFERDKFWLELAMTHLSSVNNFMLGISIGMLAFCFEKANIKEIHFVSTFEAIDVSLTLLVVSLITLAFSISYGIVVLMTRLYDFRIERNLSMTRQMHYEYGLLRRTGTYSEVEDLGKGEFDDPNFLKRGLAIYRIVFTKLPLFKRSDMVKIKKSTDLQKRYDDLCELSFVLATISWKLPRHQGVYLFLSAVLYVLSLLIG